MESTELSMDSFVDIVANTVGIVVILTMLTVLQAGQTKNEHDLDFIKLRALKLSVRQKNEELNLRQQTLNKKLAKVGMPKIDFKKPASIKTVSKKIKSRLNGVKSSLASAQSSYDSALTSLSSLSNEEKKLKEEIQKAESAISAVVQKNPGFNVSSLGGSLGDLSSKRDSVIEENKSLENQISISKKKFTELEANITRLKREVANLSSNKKQLTRLANVTINLVKPNASKDYGRAQIFIECYKPKSAGEGSTLESLRFVSEKTYSRRGSALLDPSEGETLSELDNESKPSNFRKFATDVSEVKLATRSLHFIVRPDAYAIFIEARNIALQSGWKVDWEPFPAL